MAVNLSRLFSVLGYHVGSLNLAATRNGSDYGTVVSALQSAAAADVVAAVADDTGAVLDLDAALAQVSYALTTATQTVTYKHGTVTVADVGTPTGTPKWVSTDLTAFGTNSNFLIPEVIRLRATGDDTYSLISEESVTKGDYNWPIGSGLNTTGTLIDPSSDGGLITNGNFATWAGSPLAADNWEIASGTDVWGTDFSRVADEAFTGGDGYSLKVLSDGAIKQLRQEVTLNLGSTYALHFFAKKVVFAGGTGSVVLTLRDQSGNALSSTTVTNTFTSLGTSWTAYGGVLYVPRQLPGTVTGTYLEMRWTGTSGDYFYIGDISLQELTPLYDGGPSIIGFTGVTQLTLDTDAWTCTVAVSTPNSSLVRGIDRLVGLAAKGFQFPEAASGTYDDALVL